MGGLLAGCADSPADPPLPNETAGAGAVGETDSQPPDPTGDSTGASTSGGSTDSTTGTDPESDGDGGSSGGPQATTGTTGGEIVYDTWPESAEEALARSPYWDPGVQQLHEGTVTSTAAGEVIENLHIVDGELIITHDDVVVRNVTVEALLDEDAGNHAVQITGEAQGVSFDGIYMGPVQQSWDEQLCDMPMFPASGFYSDSASSWTVRGCATRHVGDSIKANGGTGVFEDCFFEIAQGIWAVEACDPDHTDVLQINGGSPSLTFRRVWMDALRYVVDSPDAFPEPADSPGGATHLQLGGSATNVELYYDTVRLHSGNFTFRVFRELKISVINSTAFGYTYEPFLIDNGGAFTIGEWSDNTLEGGVGWDPPS